MRLNKLLMVALASMTMLSCSNDDDPGNGNLSNEEKTVVLKLEGIKSVKTRSMDEPTDKNAQDHTVTVNKVAILFYDENADKVLQVEKVESGDEDWTALTTNGKDYTNVNASVDKVMIIGNADKELEALFQTGSSPKEIREYQYSLAKENTADGASADNTTKGNVSLYGDDAIELETAATDNEDAKYKAEVKLNPLVARFEIKSVGCTFAAIPQYQKLVLRGIGLVDYYSVATFDSQDEGNGMIKVSADKKKQRTDDANGTETDAIYDPASQATITGDGSYRFCDDDNTTWKWSYDVLSENNEITATASQTKKFQNGESKEYSFAYNFFPQDGPDEAHHTPNICAWVEAYEQGLDIPDKNHTIVTSTLLDTNGAPLVPKAGEIYQLEYLFEEKHIDEWIPTITVTVKVTVAQWTVVDVTPDFGGN